MKGHTGVLSGSRVLVLGLGLSGRAAARFLLCLGAQVAAVEDNHTLLKNNFEIAELASRGMVVFSVSNVPEPLDYDLMVVSPGIPASHPTYRNAAESGLEIIGEVELACRFLKNRAVGITGTNGKTTVALMTAHILNASGKTGIALGNTGTPLITAVRADSEENDDSIFVIELSSFQLETLRSKTLDAAVLLNITPDHLDRYSTMDDYAVAKLSIGNCLKAGGGLYAHEECWNQYRHLQRDLPAQPFGFQPGSTLRSDKEHLIFKENIECILPVEYRDKVGHDVENMMAAYALCKEMGIGPGCFFQAMKSFKKPPHRIEFVAQKNGISYINDSKGTNLDAVAKAVGSLKEKIILIAGGVDKGAPYTPWIESFTGRVRCVCAIGQAAKQIQKDIGHEIPVELFACLENAVRYASSIAREGESVLLSPGCASFDMFTDYAHRGNEFKRIVNTL